MSSNGDGMIVGPHVPPVPPAPTEGRAMHRTGEQVEHPAAPPADRLCGERPVPQPRCSARATAGQHRNPHRLPTTVQAEAVGVDPVGPGSDMLAQMAQTQLLLAQMRFLRFEWGFYALSASKAIFRARTYNCITVR